MEECFHLMFTHSKHVKGVLRDSTKDFMAKSNLLWVMLISSVKVKTLFATKTNIRKLNIPCYQTNKQNDNGFLKKHIDSVSMSYIDFLLLSFLKPIFYFNNFDWSSSTSHRIIEKVFFLELT